MQIQARSCLTDVALLREFADHVAKERGATAVVLADIAEIAARKLYRQAGYPSMFEFLVREMKYSEAAVLDPYAVSGKVSMALFNELVATASVMCLP